MPDVAASTPISPRSVLLMAISCSAFFVKQIMSNAAGYFFDLALQATVPEIKNRKRLPQKMAKATLTV